MTVTKSNHAPVENDLYETEPWASDVCCSVLKTLGLWRNGPIWEPAAGNHKMVEPLLKQGASVVITSDICTYTKTHTAIYDFLSSDEADFVDEACDIFTNPPYGPGNRTAVKFARQALKRCEGYVALLLTAKFDSGSTRTDLFRDNPRFAAKVALLDRVSWMGNGEEGTEDHAWYVWGPVGEAFEARLFYERNPEKMSKAK